MAPKLGELFSSLLDEKTDEALLTSSVLSCDIDAEKRRLNLTIESDSYIKAKNVLGFKTNCLKGLQLKGIDIEIR